MLPRHICHMNLQATWPKMVHIWRISFLAYKARCHVKISGVYVKVSRGDKGGAPYIRQMYAIWHTYGMVYKWRIKFPNHSYVTGKCQICNICATYRTSHRGIVERCI